MNLELKIPPALLVLITLFLMWLSHEFFPNLRFELAILSVFAELFLLAGLLILASSVLSFLRSKTTVDPRTPEQASNIVTTGLFRYSRNPMYLGMLFIITAGALTMPTIMSGVLVPVFVLYMNRFQISPEERILQQKFGKEYLDYKAQVRRWL